MTRVRQAILGATVAVASASLFMAQSSPRVDFRRDVQPILRERCYGCHGPEQQMNGFRLDRRADALRGGTQSVIGPGNADGSKLYHRLIDTSAGARMPPTGPLGADQVAILKAWIDQGAEWPDDAAGAPRVPPSDPDAERLTMLIRDGDHNGVERLLRVNPRASRTRAAGGSTPLMFAALYGNATLVQHLIDLGADVSASNAAGATALMWAVPDTSKMLAILRSGVDVDAHSEDRRTALVTAAGVAGSAPAVRLLLEFGASSLPSTPSDSSPLREAARVNNVDAFAALVEYGADPVSIPADFLRTNCFACAESVRRAGAGPLERRPPVDTGLRPTLPTEPPMRAVPVAAVTSAAIHAAVDRSLPLLQKIGQPFIQKTGCVSCHHNSLVAMAVEVADRNGYRIDQEAAHEQRTSIANYLESWRERTIQNGFIAGQQDTISYLLFGLAAAGHPADRATDAQALWLLRRQAPDGRWPLATLRPPIESNDIEVTAMSMRAVQRYADKTRRAEADRAVVRARQFLSGASAGTTEERAFRVLGLTWAEADRGVVARAVRDLVASQRGDGGWSQESSMESDAYGTGEALVALRESGAVSTNDAAVRRGVEFLLRTQLEDGTWVVKSRAVPIQAYFESGFPHGADQWISAAASAWAVTALAAEK